MMRLTHLFIVLLTLTSLQSIGQGLYIPQASPRAALEQTIGVCNVRVDYSRPSVRGREVFGGLVPYDKVWRAGANAATILTLDKKVQFGGKELQPGKYALMTIPTKEKWTIIVNTEWDQWGAYNYDATKDVFRFTVDAAKIDTKEMCTYSFEKVDKSSGVLVLEWSTARVEIPIITDSKTQTLSDIERITDQVRSNWYSFSSAAQYHFYELGQAEEAIRYVDVAIALNAPNPSPWMLKSQILAAQGKYAEAIALAKEAIEICHKTDHAFEIPENERQIKKWSKEL